MRIPTPLNFFLFHFPSFVLCLIIKFKISSNNYLKCEYNLLHTTSTYSIMRQLINVFSSVSVYYFIFISSLNSISNPLFRYIHIWFLFNYFVKFSTICTEKGRTKW